MGFYGLSRQKQRGPRDPMIPGSPRNMASSSASSCITSPPLSVTWKHWWTKVDILYIYIQIIQKRQGMMRIGFLVDFREFWMNRLSGWWFEPLWNISISWDDYSRYMEKKKIFETTNQCITIYTDYIILYYVYIYKGCIYIYIYIHRLYI